MALANIIGQDGTNQLRQEVQALTNFEILEAAAQLREMISSNRSYSILTPSFIQAILDDLIIPDLTRRNLSISDSDQYLSAAKLQVDTMILDEKAWIAENKYFASRAAYLKIRNERLKRNKTVTIILVIVGAILIVWAWRRYKK